MALYVNDFSEIFSTLLEKSGVSCYHISQYSHLDQAYLSRLRSSKKQNPSPETIIKISLALTHYSDKINLHDIQGLFRSVGRSFRVDGEY